MRKLAFFVEGQTERLFVQALVEACAGESNVQILSERGHLGGKLSRMFRAYPVKTHTHYI